MRSEEEEKYVEERIQIDGAGKGGKEDSGGKESILVKLNSRLKSLGK